MGAIDYMEWKTGKRAEAIAADGAALYIIPLLFIKYPKELKNHVTAELKERRGNIEK